MTMADLRVAYRMHEHSVRMLESLEEKERRLQHELDINAQHMHDAKRDLIRSQRELAVQAFQLGDGAYPVQTFDDAMRCVVVIYREPRNVIDRLVQFVLGPQVEIVQVAPPKIEEVNNEA